MGSAAESPWIEAARESYDGAKQEAQEEPATQGFMPEGNVISTVREDQVETTEDGAKEPAYDNDAVATLVWRNYEEAKAYLETNTWLLEWQAADILYQSPNYDRWTRVQDGRPVRISRFLVSKNANTMSNQVHRGIFGNQRPFVLMPEGDTSEFMLEAWTHVIWVLMKRADFEYNVGLMGESQTLQGTGIGSPGWEERKRTVKRRKRKKPEPTPALPIGEPKPVPTQQSDDFELVSETITESWPFFEYRRLGTTLFDPKWRTPNRPDLSAGYVIDVDYVNFQDLQQMRALTCYENIPDDATLKKFFFAHQEGDAPPASQVAETFSAKSSIVAHAEGEQRQMSADPLERVLMLLTMWTEERAQAVLCYQGRKLTIRNEAHGLGSHALKYTANWWNVENNGYGMGIGRLNNGDQRIEQGVLNEALKMIAYPMNAPIIYSAEEGNAPTQNMILGMGTFWGIRPGPSGDVSKSIAYLRSPEIPPEAWKFMEMAKDGGEDLVGANSTTMQGNLGGPGSSAMRTASGVNRVGSKADENISRPLRHLEQVITRFIEFLIQMVREKMPLQEIRQILAKKYAKAIIDQIDLEEFLNVEFWVNVLAGQKLAAKQAITQLVPFFLQITQQPQLMEYNHQKGWTVDFLAMENLFIRMSELDADDNIFRPLTARERVMLKQMNPGAQKVQAAAVIENLRGQNKLKEVAARGQADMTTKLATVAAEHAAGSVPLERAEGLVERSADEHALQGGIPDPLA